MHDLTNDCGLLDSVGFLLTRARGLLGEFVERELRNRHLDLTHTQWATLMHISFGCARNAADLCRDSSHDTGSMTRMLDRLEEKGYIRRERSTDDRRVVRLALTEAGEALTPQLAEVARATLSHYLADFSPEDVVMLKSLLKRMIARGA